MRNSELGLWPESKRTVSWTNLNQAWVLVLGISVSWLGGVRSHAETISLSSYLEQVREKNPAIQASSKQVEGAARKASEADLMTSPIFFASASMGKDQRPMTLQQFSFLQLKPGALAASGPITELDARNLSVGLSKQTTFGLGMKVSYDWNYLGDPAIHNAATTFELTQSLLKNGFGSEVRSAQEVQEAAQMATKYGESFKLKATLTEAEGAFWRLYYARKTIRVQEGIVARAQKLFDWAQRRTGLNLGDRADQYQAQSVLELRKVELQAARDEEQAAATVFNQLRGAAKSDFSDELEVEGSLEERLTKNPVARADLREDTQAVRESSRVAIAQASMAKEKSDSTLDLFGSLSLTGQQRNAFGDATKDALGFDHKYWLVGLRFSTPLAFGTRSDANAGHDLEIESANLSFQKKVFDQEVEWNDLNRKLVESLHRLKLIQDLEKIMTERLNYEQGRLTRGRTTFSQVLLSEQDYSQTVLSRFRTESELVRVYAQLKLFGSAQ